MGPAQDSVVAMGPAQASVGATGPARDLVVTTGLVLASPNVAPASILGAAIFAVIMGMTMVSVRALLVSPQVP
jgi:hypothetical protein